MEARVTVVGAGLAGCEAAWQLAERGVRVLVLEQKPKQRTPAQHSDHFGELVCSNSLRGAALSNAVGLLKEELRRAGSLVLQAAEVARVPAGGALAVDRERFGRLLTTALRTHPNIEVRTEEVAALPEGHAILATGPLTGPRLAAALEELLGSQHLAYYDAIAPIVSAESLDWEKVFRASRYDKGGDDAYVNCPLDAAQYGAFVDAILAAEKVQPHAFEELRYFEGCLPVEAMAERGRETLAHGPMKPVGLRDPRTGARPHAVVQLRMEDTAGTAFNLVGFQSRMTWTAQAKVFRMIPGLESAEFLRFGSVHRNTFVNAPKVLSPLLEVRARPGLFLAGQLTGVEGYVESAASGLLCAVLLADSLRGQEPEAPPERTALAGLLEHTRREREDYQPSNITWAMVPPWTGRRLPKQERGEALAQRALEALEPWAARRRAELLGTRLASEQLDSPTVGG